MRSAIREKLDEKRSYHPRHATFSSRIVALWQMKWVSSLLQLSSTSFIRREHTIRFVENKHSVHSFSLTLKIICGEARLLVCRDAGGASALSRRRTLHSGSVPLVHRPLRRGFASGVGAIE